MGKTVVCTVDTQLDGKGVTYAHTILAVEHEGNAASNICVEGKRNQVEHSTVVFARVASEWLRLMWLWFCFFNGMSIHFSEARDVPQLR